MAKTRYHFNKKSLKYETVTTTIKEKVLKILSLLLSGVVFSAVTLVVLYTFVESPKERILKREIKQYELQLKLMNDRINSLSVVLADLESRDDNIYRVVFEAEPIASSLRNAGYGGANRYEALEGYRNSQLIIETTKKMDNLARRLYVQSKSFDDVIKMANNKNLMLSSIPAIQPIANKNLQLIASGFGYRIHPIYKTLKFHSGIDFAAPRGAKIYATGDGTIAGAAFDRGYGNTVVINHGYGYQTLYAHMSSIKVRKGQKVKRGDIIGSVGSTGLSIAPHLHYEIVKNNVKINPINFFHRDLSPEDYQKAIEISSRVTQTLSYE